MTGWFSQVLGTTVRVYDLQVDTMATSEMDFRGGRRMKIGRVQEVPQSHMIEWLNHRSDPSWECDEHCGVHQSDSKPMWYDHAK